MEQSYKKRARREKVMEYVFLAAACMSILCVALICVFLFANGLPAMGEIGVFKFLSGKRWKPSADIYGIFPMILGSIYVTAGALALGVPIALLTAIYLAFFCPKNLYRIVKPAVELLAGIPSVVYGFFGIVGFLESRPQNATAVALEKTACMVITHESFSHYFQERPAKVMSIMQYMSKRMRILTRGYLEASQALEEYADAERLLKERKDWYEEHKDLYHRIMGLFGFD